ncbi:Putative ribonuclease H protein At1g65750, partial [Linum perenne]
MAEILVSGRIDGWTAVLFSRTTLSIFREDIALQVIGMSPPRNELGCDTLVWGLEPNGVFSVRSAFYLLNDFSSNSAEPVWDHSWRWDDPNKIKHFLWITSHNRLMTNEERGRRHLTNQIWENSLPWVLAERGKFNDFGTWWTANALVEQCKFWTSLVLSSWKTNQLGREAPSLARQTQLIVWRPRDEGWSTLNTDGSRRNHSCQTAIGGLLRDERGAFVHAFCANIGDCSITIAELRAIVEGIKLAWNLGVRRVAVRSDSRTTLDILHRETGSTSQHAALVAEFCELRSRDCLEW